MMRDDMELVREFAAKQSEPAFAEIVQRHIGLVHSAAMRQVRDAHLAEEIAQAVFILLARKAPSLGPQTILSAWLYRTTRYVAADALKTQRRRQHREQEAHMQTILNEPDTDAWAQLAPLLDDAMAALNETDRSALVLRFFEKKTAREIAAALRVEEEAVQKRITRGVEKLRKYFVKRGVTQTAATLGVVLAANSVQAAPLGLAITISAATVKGAAVAASVTAIVNGTIKTIAMTPLQKTLIAVSLVAAVGTGIYEARRASILETQVEALQQQQAPLANQNQQLTRERDDVTNRLASLAEELAKANRNNTELVKLRGEVGLLRSQLANANNEASQPKQEPLGSAYEYYQRAQKHERDHRFEAELEDLNKAIELDPSMVAAYFERASLFSSKLPVDRGGLVKAIEDYTSILEIKPDDSSARNNRALYYREQREIDKALADYNFLIEGDVDYSMNVEGKDKSLARQYFNRATVYHWYKRDYQKGVDDYTAALKLDPLTDGAYRRRGECYEKLGETEKAAQDFAAAKVK